jgi:predicted dehydrogenase
MSGPASGQPARVGIALIGCGFVADYYMATIELHDELQLIGVHDRDARRLTAFAEHHGARAFAELDAILDDERVEIVVNLTNPREHSAVTQRALERGRHVYSEKPLAMDLEEAKHLVRLAEAHERHLCSAPCSVLGETAQTVWQAIRADAVGPVRLVYAEMDEGMVFRMPYHRWRSASGASWPAQDEFEVGTVIEHAGYVVSWLPAMFGAATHVAGFSAQVFPDKGRNVPLAVDSVDFAVACITFEGGVLARLTCSLVAPHDHSLRVVGDHGVLTVKDTWHYTSPVRVRRWFNIRGRHVERPFAERYPLAAKGERYRYRGTQQMDFARGVADLANAIRSQRPPRLSTRYSLHVNEIVLAVSGALTGGGTYAMTTVPDPMEPMPWATERPRRRRLSRSPGSRSS